MLCGKLQNNPRVSPIFEAGQLQGFIFPRGKTCFQRHFFSEESGRFPPDSGNDGVGLMGKPVLSLPGDSVDSSSDWPWGRISRSASAALDGTACPPFGVESGRLTTLRFPVCPRNFFLRPGSATCLIYGVSYLKASAPVFWQLAGLVRRTACLLPPSVRWTNFPVDAGKGKEPVPLRRSWTAFFFHGIAKDRPVIESIIETKQPVTEWVALDRPPTQSLAGASSDGHLQIMSDQIADHGLTVFMLLRPNRKMGRGNKTKLQQELGRTERFNAFSLGSGYTIRSTSLIQ